MNIEYEQRIWALNKNDAIKDVRNLIIGEYCFYPESDYGHGIIKLTYSGYECWSIPRYGGEHNLENTFDNAEDAFNEVISWT